MVSWGDDRDGGGWGDQVSGVNVHRKSRANVGHVVSMLSSRGFDELFFFSWNALV